MDEKLKLAIRTIFEALTAVWDDNGNIKAEVVRDNVMNNLAALNDLTVEQIQAMVESMIEDAQ
jgi:hypothetical protein